MLLNNSNTPQLTGSPGVHSKERHTTHHKAVIYLGSFFQIRFVALLAGQVTLDFARWQKEKVLEAAGGKAGQT